MRKVYPYCPYFKKHRKRMYPSQSIAQHHCFDGMHPFICPHSYGHWHVGHDKSKRVARRVTQAKYDSTFTGMMES